MLRGPGITITVVALLIWCGITAWLVVTNGQSIGKRLVGIKVVRTDGSPRLVCADFPAAQRGEQPAQPVAVHRVGYTNSCDPLLIYQDSRQCMHDLIADTIVVRCVSKVSDSN